MPFAAVPTSSMSAVVARSCSRPERTTTWSSTITHADLRCSRFRFGRHRSILSSIGMVTWTLVPVPGLDRTWSEPWRSAARPASDRSPTWPSAVWVVQCVGGEPPAVVIDDQDQRAVLDVERHSHLGGRRVRHDVAERLLGDPVRQGRRLEVDAVSPGGRRRDGSRSRERRARSGDRRPPTADPPPPDSPGRSRPAGTAGI